MSNTKYGLTSWEAVTTGKKDFNKEDGLYLKLDKSGVANTVRILTDPYQFLVHKFKDESDTKGFGITVGCSKEHGTCPICELPGDNYVSRRWYVGVIDRKHQQYKLLELSPTLFELIKGYKRSEHWGDLTKYDIDITVNKNAAPANYYSVQPIPKTNLSSADLEIKTNIDLEDLERRCMPPEPSKVVSRLEYYFKSLKSKKEQDNKGSSRQQTQQVVKKAVPAPVEDDSNDDEDYSFNPVD